MEKSKKWLVYFLGFSLVAGCLVFGNFLYYVSSLVLFSCIAGLWRGTFLGSGLELTSEGGV